MPEICEVETLKNQIKPLVENKKIIKIETVKSLFKEKNLNFNKIKNLNIIKLHRVAKKIIFEFDKNIFLETHLGMTGSWTISTLKNLNKKQKHLRYIFYFENFILLFSDIRGFGSFKMTDCLDTTVDVLNDNFDVNSLNIWTKDKIIYSVLHDQKIFPGVGAYLGAEILFDAKIHPEKKLINFNQKDKELFQFSLKKILLLALKTKGASFSDYKHLKEETGSMQNFFKVYGRVNLPCLICGSLINKLDKKRGSQFCPVCQKK